MRKSLLLMMFALSSYLASAQTTFTFDTNCGLSTPIPDQGCFNGNSINQVLTTSGIPGGNLNGSSLALREVRVIASHTWNWDLDIYLISPQGTEIQLSTDNGQIGDNYGNPNSSTCDRIDCAVFTMIAATPVTSVANTGINIIGEYRPEGDFASFNGENPNGDWVLRICDDGTVGQTGSLEYFYLEFGDPCGADNPTDFRIHSISANMFGVGWNSKNPGATYEISYGTPGTAPGAGTVITASNSTGPNFVSTAANLTPNTSYTAYVRELCPSGNASSWVGPISVTTDDDEFLFASPCGMDIAIPESNFQCGNSLEFGFPVSGLNTTLGTDVFFNQAGLVIEHDWVDNLDIYLRSPEGTEVMLSTDNGSLNDNYGNPNGNCQGNNNVTFFSSSATNFITGGTPPYTDGPYIPEGNLDAFVGENPNGNWVLRVCDDGFINNSGELEFFTIEFAPCPNPKDAVAGKVSATTAELRWNATAPINYEIEIGNVGFTPGTGAEIEQIVGTSVIGVNSATTTLPLTPDSPYDFYIRNDCGNGAISNWVGPISFFSAIQVTKSSDNFFEDFGTPTCDLPEGWRNVTLNGGEKWLFTSNAAFWGPRNTDHTTGDGCYAWVDDGIGFETALETRYFDMSALDNCDQLGMRFWWWNANPQANWTWDPLNQVSLEVSTNGGVTWTSILTTSGRQEFEWKEEIAEITPYISESVLFRFREISGGNVTDLSIDDVEVFKCQAISTVQERAEILAGTDRPMSVVAVNVNYTEATFCDNSMTGIEFNTNGTTDVTDILNAKLYISKSASSFYPERAEQFGSTVVSPTGQFSFTGTYDLANGDNYFWLAYELDPTADTGNIIDAEIVSVSLGACNVVPEDPAPAGNRRISEYAPIVYVTSTGAGTRDGSSWANAYEKISDALDAARPYQEIWVATGIYTPGTSRSNTFEMSAYVDVYGGFIGNETDRSQRSIEFNKTTLSGDIGTFGDNSDNVYHVVTVPDFVTAKLDGFTITGGNADDNSSIFTIDDVGGGAITSQEGARGIFVNCTFIDNTSTWGGGLFSGARGDFVSQCKFIDNTGTNSGGAIYSFEEVYVDNTFFLGNFAGFGAGLYERSFSYSGPVEISNCVFSGNTATVAGGALRMWRGGITVNNSTFSNNTSTNVGELLAILDQGEFVMENSISYNTSSVNNEVDEGDDGNVIISNSIIADINYEGLNGSINQNPLFVRPRGRDGVIGTIDDYLAIRPNSLARNAADTATATDITIDGFARDSLPDLGAYETTDCPIPYEVRIEGLTSTSVTIGWESGGSDRTDLVIVPTGDPIVDDSIKQTKFIPYTFQGLTPIKTYDVYVRDNCSKVGDGKSSWVGPLTFTTPPLNDECDGAIGLLVNISCESDTGSNFASTNSTASVGAPGSCANFNGGDVWYKATVPNTGVITFRTGDADGIQNTGIEIYSGACDNLVSEACNDDNLGSGFSQATATGLTGNSTAYVRVWSNGGASFGRFLICALRAPVIFINDVQSSEQADQLEFTVNLTGVDGSDTVSVDFATEDGTATVVEDYDQVSGTLTFLPGEVSKKIQVPLNGDRLDEFNETMYVRLSNPTNAILDRLRGEGTLIDDDPLPKLRLFMDSTSYVEGDFGIGNTATVFLQVDTASGREMSFDYVTTSSSATYDGLDGDFQRAIIQNVTIPAGQTFSTSFEVDIYGDRRDEGDFEAFFITVLNAENIDLDTSSQAEVVILDDDSSPVAVDDLSYTVNEDDTLRLDAALGVLANDSDADPEDANLLEAILTRNTQFGFIDLNQDGSFSYTPNPDYFGFDQFSYRTTDGINLSEEATVRIEVLNSNDIPVIEGLESLVLAVCTQGNTTTTFNGSAFAKDSDDDVTAIDFVYDVVAESVTSESGTVTLGDLNISNNAVTKVIEFTTTASEPATFSVRMTVTDPSGGADTAFMLVQTGSSLTVDFVFDEECATGNTVFTNESSSEFGSLQMIEWDFDGDGVYEIEGYEVLNVYETSGTKSVSLKVTNETGCFGEITKNITILEPYVPTISQDRELLTASDGVSFQWYLNDEIIPGAVAQELFITQLGSYSVVVTNADGCTAISAPFGVTTTGVSFNDISNTLKLFPNPASEYTNISMKNTLRGAFTIQVMSISGQILREVEVVKDGKALEYQLNVEGLPSGTYLIQMINGDYRAINKFEKI